MSILDQATDEPADAELISRVRGGDVEAYGPLFERHRDAARRLARSLMPGPDSDDLVSEAFSKVLDVLLGGGGPDLAFRAYLLTAVRRCHLDRMRARKRVSPTDQTEVYDRAEPFEDTALAAFDGSAAARAYQSLPQRWQMVLWHLEVEGQRPADIAPLLGMSANSVSALAYRAREGLRQAFLQRHAADLVDDSCRWCNERLGAYVRGGLSRRDSTKVDDHLQSCRRCTGIYLELNQVNSSLGAVVGPVVLGSAAVAYLSHAGTVTAGGAAGLGAGVGSGAAAGGVAGSGVPGVLGSTAVGLKQAVLAPLAQLSGGTIAGVATGAATAATVTAIAVAHHHAPAVAGVTDPDGGHATSSVSSGPRAAEAAGAAAEKTSPWASARSAAQAVTAAGDQALGRRDSAPDQGPVPPPPDPLAPPEPAPAPATDRPTPAADPTLGADHGGPPDDGGVPDVSGGQGDAVQPTPAPSPVLPTANPSSHSGPGGHGGQAVPRDRAGESGQAGQDARSGRGGRSGKSSGSRPTSSGGATGDNAPGGGLPALAGPTGTGAQAPGNPQQGAGKHGASNGTRPAVPPSAGSTLPTRPTEPNQQTGTVAGADPAVPVSSAPPRATGGRSEQPPAAQADSCTVPATNDQRAACDITWAMRSFAEHVPPTALVSLGSPAGPPPTDSAPGPTGSRAPAPGRAGAGPSGSAAGGEALTGTSGGSGSSTGGPATRTGGIGTAGAGAGNRGGAPSAGEGGYATMAPPPHSGDAQAGEQTAGVPEDAGSSTPGSPSSPAPSPAP